MTETAGDVAQRLLDAAAGMFDLMAVALGDRLGLYRCFADGASRTPPELAEATGTSERYALEWLEQQAVTGFFAVDDETRPGRARRYRLMPGVEQVLCTPDDLSYLAPLARQLVAAARLVPAVADAFRTGGGVPWASFGDDMRESEGDLNRPAYLHLLADDWLAALPDVQNRLRADPPARAADIGCGAGWSSIALAKGYPKTQVDAFDVDAASVELARHNVVEAGLTHRVRVRETDITTLEEAGSYDLVMAFECLHDMPYPVAILTAMRKMVSEAGAVLVADMKVSSRFTAPGDLVERLMYGFSLSVCLPDSMSSPDSAATGTVMRQDTMSRYATEAGFGTVEVLPVEHDLWRFYRLR